MNPRRTRMLFVLLLLSLVATAISRGSLLRARRAAESARDDLELCRQQLADLHRWRNITEGGAPASADTSQVVQLLRRAASDAGAEHRLLSIEPGQPSRGDGDYSQTLVFLRLESISLRELTLFLQRLFALDEASRAQSIELYADGVRDGQETWNADISVGYLSPSTSERVP